jgi:hypothetical protein
MSEAAGCRARGQRLWVTFLGHARKVTINRERGLFFSKMNLRGPGKCMQASLLPINSLSARRAAFHEIMVFQNDQGNVQ